MSVINEIIRLEQDNTLSFGNHLVEEKQKVENFDVAGDLFKVKTHTVMTKLEKNGILVYESLPGTVVRHLDLTGQGMNFTVEGKDTARITVELEPDSEYKLFVDDLQVDKMKSNLSGKITFSLSKMTAPQSIKIESSK